MSLASTNHPAAAAATLVSRPSRWKRIGNRLLPMLLVVATLWLLKSSMSWAEGSLRNESFVTGYSLCLVSGILLALPLRKRLIQYRLGNLGIWQHVHHYVGVASICIYALHAGIYVDGVLEICLAISFWFVALSGVVSWYINSTSPKLLRAAGKHVLREDIAEQKRLVAEQAYRLALESAGRNDTVVLADYYRAELSKFFLQNRSLSFRLLPTGRKRRALVAGLDNLHRYLSDRGRDDANRMVDLVGIKDNLDFQQAIQLRIRTAASLHTMLISTFVVLAGIHAFLAHRYTAHW